jgi:hypothetical protein
MTEKHRIRFRRIKLSTQDVEQLVKDMEAASIEADDLDLLDEAAIHHELNKKLTGTFEPGSIDQIVARDPTACDDDVLWQRIQSALPVTQPKSRKTRNHRRLAGSAVVGIAAAAFLTIFWPSHDGEGLRRSKGVFLGSVAYQGSACRLAMRTAGETIDLSLDSVTLPGAQPVLLLASCQNSGFLHLEIQAYDQTLRFINLAVTPGSTWQELLDGNRAPAGFALPERGQLTVISGFTRKILSAEEGAQLANKDKKPDEAVWQWMRQDQWPIGSR